VFTLKSSKVQCKKFNKINKIKLPIYKIYILKLCYLLYNFRAAISVTHRIRYFIS